MWLKKIVALLLLTSLVIVSGCLPSGEATEKRMKRVSIFIGIDASASFARTGNYDEAITFLAHYIYGHMKGYGGLNEPKALYVAPIGGFSPDEPKSFRPIHDFQKKSIAQIEADLKEWLVPDQTITDFNVFLDRIKVLIQKNNLVLTPINIVIVSDGVPSKLTKSKKKVVRMPFNSIDLSNLDYLARHITVRLLYPTPVVAEKWETEVKRNRVRMNTVDDQVMKGWREQVVEGKPAAEQEELWKWMKDIVDKRVRRRTF